MAEEQTSSVAPETPSTTDSAPMDSGQSIGQTSRESAEPQPQDQSSTTSPKSTSGEKSPKKVNLYDIPEFRQFQSETTRKNQQREQQLQQQLQQYEQRMTELEDANLDDYEKAQKRAERAEAKLYQFQQSVEQEKRLNAENQRILDDMNLVSDKTGIPVEELFNAKSFNEALDMGLTYMKEQGSTQAKQDDAKREANRTVVGGGKASTPTSRTEKSFQEAMESGDVAAYVRGLRLQNSK